MNHSKAKEIIPVIDCDVHNQFRSSKDLVPYLEEPWKSHVAKFGVSGGGLPYASPIGNKRKDADPPSGLPVGSDPDYMLEHLVEPFHMEYALLCSDSIIGVSGFADPDYTAAICRAYNDYLIAEWLSKSPKFKGFLCIGTQDPEEAAREIDRIGPHPDIVGVAVIGGSRSPYGQRFYHPIYAACERHGLPFIIHPGAEGAGVFNPPTAVGYVSNYLQWHTCLPQTYMAHLVSFVCEGVFEKFPGLKVVFSEGGVSWLPSLLWRLDKNFKALRASAPWLKRMPSEYVRDHCYMTTQPIEEPDNPKHLDAVFEMFDAEHMLLFSSDYPHWDFDDPTKILQRLPIEKKRKIFSGNAKQLFKLT
ncbi:Predicted metal-dependent hydrolase, TIM-barrel fold [Paenibacillus sp. UNCCL117]|uniref:amidohydrolase family protein n=1 Tax=unclassified Paenibacillus TaxID=185978 RepID=UPI0008905212|nr:MULTISPECIES: amidohydrolase family protein [unclassified Paenibacillus]SDC48939.1 Predicted metal-dependent hydrolase, TIM-barrel fold [Paenibacillus sp. cl123]SFW11851.1 Predicted metal-dependent hydrolase, TIM-barrel fold [Paenibacillus sp. UNCCL117]